MKRPQELPAELRGRVFTRRQALSLGVSGDRLYAADVRRIGRGIYQHAPERGAARPDRTLVLRALCAKYPGIRVSHTTAAHVLGLPLPGRLSTSEVIHLSSSANLAIELSDRQVRVHHPRIYEEETLGWDGMRLSTRLRVLIDLMSSLSVEEQVILLDHLLRVPRPRLEYRRVPWAVREQIQEIVDRHAGSRGMARLRRATELAKVGSDSPGETRLRLAIVEADLPEPELQIRLDPGDAYSPEGDLGYRAAKVVLQYEGEHHFTREQQVLDQRRNAAFEAQGWTVVLVNSVHARSRFAEVIARLRRLLEKR